MLPWLLCGALAAIVLILCARLRLLQKSLDEIAAQLGERLGSDTNNPIFLSARDPHARKLAGALNVQLKELRRLRQRYENGDRELKEAVTNVSHDLRTPLTAICGYLELLDRGDKTPDQARYLSLISDRAEAMRQLTEEWMEEEERLRQQRLAEYEGCLLFLLLRAMETDAGEVSLEEIRQSLDADGEEYARLLPSVQIFKEVMVELLRGREIDIEVLREERRNFIGEFSGGFQLNEMLLNLIEEHSLMIRQVTVYRIEDGKVIAFDNVPDETGRRKRVCCSNVLIRVAGDAAL